MKAAFKWLIITISASIALIFLMAILGPKLFPDELEKQFKNPQILSETTGVEFPAYKVKHTNRGLVALNGDFSDTMTAEFLEVPDAAFYEAIERQSTVLDQERDGIPEPCWSISDNGECKYSRVWGGWKNNPPGNWDDRDVVLEIFITKGEKKFTITYGVW